MGNTEHFAEKLILANAENIKNAIEYVENKKVGGATNINSALLESIALIKRSEYSVDAMNQIILNVQKANDGICSIFAFGVGSDDNSWIDDLDHNFLKVLAANNDGIYSRIKEMQCDTQLAQHFEILSKPMLKNIAIEYNEAVRVTNTEFNALNAGNDIIICGQLKNKNCKTMKVSINASCGKDKFEKEICVDIDCQTFNCNIERIWAYLTLKQCATKQLMIEGIDDNKNEQMAMAIAMKYKFVTPWTSMIVVQSKEQQSNKSSKKRKNAKIYTN